MVKVVKKGNVWVATIGNVVITRNVSKAAVNRWVNENWDNQLDKTTEGYCNGN